MTIFDLFTGVVGPVFSNWIPLIDITLLDSAVCNRFDRREFLNIISRNDFSHSDKASSSWPSHSCLEWLILRKMKVLHLGLRNISTYKPSLAKYLDSFVTLNEISAQYSHNLLGFIAKTGINISSLTLLWNNEIISGDEFKLFLSKFKHQLIELDISGVKDVTDDFFVHITKYFPNLEVLRTSYMSEVSSKVLTRGCKQLRTLIIRSFDDLTDETFVDMIKCCSLLERICLPRVDEISDVSVCALADNCPHLKDICLTGSLSASDESIRKLTENCRYMTVFRMSCGSITDASLLLIARHWSFIVELDLLDAELISDDGCCAVARSCTKLTKISLSGCVKVTDVSVMCFAEYCPKLETVDLSACRDVSDFSVTMMLEKCTMMELLAVADTRVTCCSYIKAAKGATSLSIVLCGDADSNITKTPLALRGGTNGLHVKLCIEYNDGRYDDDAPKFYEGAFKMLALQCPQLTTLNIVRRPQLSDGALDFILKNCPLISSLSLIENVSLTSAVTVGIRSHLKHIHSLELSDVDDLDDTHIITLLRATTRWKSLTIDRCLLITNLLPLMLPDLCPELRELSLSNNVLLTDVGVLKVIENCSKLKTLNVSYCVLLTRRVLEAIPQFEATNLTSLNVDSCELISKDDIIRFLSQWGNRTKVVQYYW